MQAYLQCISDGFLYEYVFQCAKKKHLFNGMRFSSAARPTRRATFLYAYPCPCPWTAAAAVSKNFYQLIEASLHS